MAGWHPRLPDVIPGRRQKRVHARLRRAMAAGPESKLQCRGSRDSGLAGLRPRPGMTKCRLADERGHDASRCPRETPCPDEKQSAARGVSAFPANVAQPSSDPKALAARLLRLLEAEIRASETAAERLRLRSGCPWHSRSHAHARRARPRAAGSECPQCSGAAANPRRAR